MVYRSQRKMSFRNFSWPAAADSLHIQIGFFPWGERAFFAIEAVSVCVAVRRHASALGAAQSYFLAAFMSLVGRILVSIVIHSPIPIFKDGFYVCDFTLIWLAVNYLFFDIPYKILNHSIVLVLLPFRSFVQVRQLCDGCDLAVRFPQISFVGQIFLSSILSSADSFLWLLCCEETRDFSNRVIFRNLIGSILYAEIVSREALVTGTAMRLYMLAFYNVLHVLDMLLFGIRSRQGIDVTLLTYVWRFSYC